MRILTLVTNDHAGFFRQQVTGIRARGHTVDVLAVPGYSKEVDRTVLTHARYCLRSIGAALGPYDLVHANYGLTAPPAVIQPRHPVVLTLWGSDLMGKYGSVSRLCSRFVDEVVVMSAEMAVQCDRDCHVIPHGIDVDLFRPLPRETARRELEWDDERHHVLFPYDQSREVKDFPRASRIVDRLGTELDDPVDLHSVSGIAHRRMPLYMNAADVLLLTSKREGMPNSVKEALACNLPVVATAVSDLPALLADVSHSTTAETDDALADAVQEVLLSGERSNGRSAIDSLAIDTQIDKLERVYRSAIDE
ncbi:glycosyltransferase [Halorubrum sp. JWXQ-INN 858]|uniref:glycosyltransferase n=1 Tax=Halorubrum sp. JWXQ-INN 858 TaxID=2690782 RepID=UPI0013F6D3E3|nr:glycosyltransferase [Halorubrum sp. JWXQ-INN 858]MWV65497.1 glycosyltransferase [Halorubrum sp. JWXQ-INN 858]